jgi:predicted esterase
VITFGFGEAARDRLEAAGAAVEWRGPPIGHELDPGTVLRARQLLATLFTA